MQRDIWLNKKITPVICSYFYLTTFITKENMTLNLMCQHMFVHEHSAITIISMLDEALWIIVLMDLVVTYETWICWLCVFEGIASILKKTNIDTGDTLIYPHWFIFIFISQFLKKKIKQYRLQRPVLNWFTESNKKLYRWCCMGVDKSERKILFLLPQNIKTVHVSHSSIFLYQEFSEKYIVKICRQNILKIQ